jgi:hypothetical protein
MGVVFYQMLYEFYYTVTLMMFLNSRHPVVESADEEFYKKVCEYVFKVPDGAPAYPDFSIRIMEKCFLFNPNDRNTAMELLRKVPSTSSIPLNPVVKFTPPEELLEKRKLNKNVNFNCKNKRKREKEDFYETYIDPSSLVNLPPPSNKKQKKFLSSNNLPEKKKYKKRSVQMLKQCFKSLSDSDIIKYYEKNHDNFIRTFYFLMDITHASHSDAEKAKIRRTLAQYQGSSTLLTNDLSIILKSKD